MWSKTWLPQWNFSLGRAVCTMWPDISSQRELIFTGLFSAFKKLTLHQTRLIPRYQIAWQSDMSNDATTLLPLHREPLQDTRVSTGPFSYSASHLNKEPVGDIRSRSGPFSYSASHIHREPLRDTPASQANYQGPHIGSLKPCLFLWCMKQSLRRNMQYLQNTGGKTLFARQELVTSGTWDREAGRL